MSRSVRRAGACRAGRRSCARRPPSLSARARRRPPVEFWVRIEFAPWFRGFSDLPDEDGDGVPEMYARIAPTLGDTTAIARFIREDYEGRVLMLAEVAGWAHRLASYWYPSYNTDLVDARGGWPSPDTEADVRKEAGDLALARADRRAARQAPRQGGLQRLRVDQTGGAGPAAAPPSRKDGAHASAHAFPRLTAAPVARVVRRSSRRTAARGPRGRRRSRPCTAR